MATKLITTREERGQIIAKLEGQIKRIDANTYEVLSQSGHGKYELLKTSIDWMCQCPDHIYRGVTCKHIHAVLFSKSIRAEVAIRKISPINNLSECIYCHSENIMKKGLKKTKVEHYKNTFVETVENTLHSMLDLNA